MWLDKMKTSSWMFFFSNVSFGMSQPSEAKVKVQAGKLRTDPGFGYKGTHH